MYREEYKDKIDKMFDYDAKIKAFDKIAEKFYYGNFGSTSKADVETLMFSLYIEQILEKEQDNMVAYSDYSLSKALGITQSKISNLKFVKNYNIRIKISIGKSPLNVFLKIFRMKTER